MSVVPPPRRIMQPPLFLPAATARWSISAVSPPSSAQRTIETNELNMTLMSHMTPHDSV